MVLQESVTKISWRDSLHRRESAISHDSRRPQTETAGAHQWEKTVLSSRQSGMKPQRKNSRGRKSKQQPYHPHPKPSFVQSAVGSVHQESVSASTNEYARINHQPSQQSSSARNEPSSHDTHQGYFEAQDSKPSLPLLFIFVCLFHSWGWEWGAC